MNNSCAAVLIIAFSASISESVAQNFDDRRPRERSEDQELRDQNAEHADLDGRVRDYLRRHGDLGVIDPERMRRLVREEYERWESEQHQLHPLSIGGTTWVNIGPTNFAGRIRAMAPDPVTGATLYAGSASGGVWETTDSGVTWSPLTEGVADLAVGSIAVFPSSPRTIYVGTGEVVPGIGMLKSTDGGAHWSLPEANPVLSGWYSAVSVNPTNVNDVLVGTAAGGFRSSDGAQHWTAWVVPGTTTAIRQIVRDPTSANILYATTLGSSATVIKSTDGGSNWSSFSTGLPTVTLEIKVAISSNATTLYAAFDLSGVAKVYKSVSGGSWTGTAAVDPSYLYFGQSDYNNTITVAPGTTDTVIVCGSLCSKSTNGGGAWAQPSMSGGSYHVDVHDLQYDVSGTLYFATDGGIYTSPDSGNNSVDRNTGLVTSQFYKITLDRSNPDRVMGGLQDNGTWRRLTPTTTWDFLISSDGQGCLFNGVNPALGWASNQAYSGGNYLWKSKDVAGASSPPLFVFMSPVFPSGEQLPFDTQLEADPKRVSVMYTNTTRVWQSKSGGDLWTPLPTTTTDGSTWNSYVVDTIAVAPSDFQTIMVGKGPDVYRSTDGGVTWVRRISGLPGWWVNALAIDPFFPNTAYVGFATTNGNSVYWTTDGGSTWIQHSAGLPNFSAEVLRVDPLDSTAVYCGTDVGVYRSTNHGVTWTPFGTGMPKVAVYDLRISDDGTLLRAGTHGRGVWDLQIPASLNHAPSVSITSPASPMTVAKGTSVPFSGSISDVDGDQITGAWIFPDTWESAQLAAAGTSNTSHVFNSTGIWPVSLSARDTSGATSSAVVNITVTEAGETCGSPIPLPAGPFPVTLSVNTETYATSYDPTDPTLLCYFGGDVPWYTAWFTFTAPTAGTYDFSTCGSNFDTVLASFTGSCGALTLTTNGCSDDIDPSGSSGCPNGGSTVSVALTAGQTIHLMVGGKYGYTSRGLITLTVKLSGSTAPTVTRVASTAGPSTGGSPMTLYGTNFASGMSVSLGGTPATSVSMLTSNVATATTAAHAAGTVDVAVTTTASGRLSNGYTYINCSIAISSSSVTSPPEGMTGSFSVTATSGCGWTAVANVGWIETASSGIGNGTVNYAVLANTSILGRSGTLTVADKTFTVTQNGVLPSHLVATAFVITQVTLTWSATTVDHFEIWRNSGTGFSQLDTSTTNSYFDNAVSAHTTYVYKIRAVDSAGNMSAYTNNDLATTFQFSNEPLLPFSTLIKAEHLTQLRQTVNYVRATANKPPASFTDPSPLGVVIKAIHITELRLALDEARTALSVDALTYTPISSGSVIGTTEFEELRNGVR